MLLPVAMNVAVLAPVYMAAQPVRLMVSSIMSIRMYNHYTLIILECQSGQGLKRDSNASSLQVYSRFSSISLYRTHESGSSFGDQMASTSNSCPLVLAQYLCICRGKLTVSSHLDLPVQ